MGTTRKSFFYFIFSPWWKPVSLWLWVAYQIWQVVRDECLPNAIVEKYRLREIVPMISWYWWIIATLFFMWIGTAWNAFKEYTNQETENSKFKEDIKILEDKLSNSEIKIVDWQSFRIVNYTETERYLVLQNDSKYHLTGCYAIIEEAKFSEDEEKSFQETGLIKNTHHILFREETDGKDLSLISGGDNFQLLVADSIKGKNAFKFLIKGKDGFNIFENIGTYIVRLRIGGTINQIGKIKRVDIYMYFDGEKQLNIFNCIELP